VIEIDVVKEADKPTIFVQVDISSMLVVLSDSEHLARGKTLFSDLAIHMKTKSSNHNVSCCLHQIYTYLIYVYVHLNVTLALSPL